MILKKIKNFYQSNSWSPYFILFILIFAVYGHSTFFDYSYFDDHYLILDNADILKRANVEEIFLNDVFFSVNKFYYRPLLTWSLSLDWHLGSSSVHFFHFTNIVLHFLAACLLFYLLRLSFIEKNKALWLTSFFAIHPVLTQAVAWIPGRNDSLLAIFVFSSLIFFNNFLQSQKKRYLILLWLFFLAALLTKETAIILPFLALFWAFVFKREQLNRLKILIISSGVLVVSFIWYLARDLALNTASSHSLWPSIFDNILSPFLFLTKIFWPFNLSVYQVVADVNYWLGVIIFLIILLLVYRNGFRNWSKILFGLTWFYLLLLFSSLRPDGEAARNFMEHRLYLPMFGLLLALAYLESPKYPKNSKIIKGLSIILLLCLSVLSFKHSLNFQNRFTFWQQAITSSPSSALAHRNLGAMYYLEGDLDQAKYLFEKSLSLNSQEPMVNNNLALIYFDKGDFDSAEKYLKAELEINPNYDKALFNLGRLYYQLNDFNQAAFFWQKALEINPRYYQAALSLQGLYREQR